DHEAGEREERKEELLPDEPARAVPAEEPRVIPPRLLVSGGAAREPRRAEPVDRERVIQPGDVREERRIEKRRRRDRREERQRDRARGKFAGRRRRAHPPRGEQRGGEE